MTYSDPFNQHDSNVQQGYQNPQVQYSAANSANPVINAQPVRVSERAIRTSVAAAYGEMSVGLLVTAAVAWASAAFGWTYSYLVATGNIGWWALMIAQVGLAVVLAMRVLKMSPAIARLLFYVYAGSMGFTLSTIFLIYDLGSIGLAFALTAGFFLALTMIGLTTKRNLLKAGPILFTGLIVLIIAEVLLMLFNVSGMTMIVAGITLILFAALTAYDAQKTRLMYQQLGTSDVMVKRISILAALNLYLDFINMFLSLLQLVGNRS